MSLHRTMSLGFAADARAPALAFAPMLHFRLWCWTVAGLACVGSSGCTALISTASLRETVLNAAGAATDVSDDEPAAADDKTAAEPLVLVKPAVSAEQTIDEAIERLAEAGRLDEAAQAALISMLEASPQEDWPEIIDAFVEALDASHVVAKPVATQPPPQPPAEPPASAPVIAIAASEPAPADAPAAAATEPDPAEPPLLFPAIEAVTPMVFPIGDQPREAIEPVAAVAEVEPPAPPPLVVANACFATRVRGWGVVDRFETNRFRPGQDVIIYFELENLESRATDSGHTTRIDTALKLVANDGRTLHDWSFEPVEETCPARRRDYFARYVLRLPPDMPPEPCRLEVSVTDTVADRTAVASLPLELTTR